MSWWKTTEQRQIVAFPGGTDWRCRAEGCDFTEPEDARPSEVACPDCGGQLWRERVRL